MNLVHQMHSSALSDLRSLARPPPPRRQVACFPGSGNGHQVFFKALELSVQSSKVSRARGVRVARGAEPAAPPLNSPSLSLARVVRPVSARSAGPIATEPRAGVQRLAASQILSRTACRSWTLWPFRICAGRPGDAPPHPDICAGSSDGDSYRGRAACRIVDRERGFEQGRQGPGSQPEQGPLVVFGPPLRRSHPSRCCGPGPALTAIGRRRVGTAGRVVGVGAYAAAGSR